MIDNQRHEELRFLTHNRQFLGREFLTWLFYGTAKRYHYDLKISLFVDEKIKLIATAGEFREMGLKGGTPEHTQNVRQALLKGAWVDSMRICMQALDSNAPGGKDTIYSWTMDSCDLNPKSLKMPAVSEKTAAEHQAKRAEHIDYVTDTIDKLFALYMETRMDAAAFAAFRGAFTAWADL
jgi:hypothetical protein